MISNLNTESKTMKILDIGASAGISAIDGNVVWVAITLVIRGIEYYLQLRKKRKEQQDVSSTSK